GAGAAAGAARSLSAHPHRALDRDARCGGARVLQRLAPAEAVPALAAVAAGAAALVAGDRTAPDRLDTGPRVARLRGSRRTAAGAPAIGARGNTSRSITH